MSHSTGRRSCLAAALAFFLLGAGEARAQSSVPESSLEVFLGLQDGDLSGLGNGPVMNGSALMTTITVSAGTTLSFDYNFLTDEPMTSPLDAVNDFGFLTAPGLASLADTFSPLVPWGSGFLRETGYRTFSETFAVAGTYTLGIGVVNVVDEMNNSALLLDNFRLSSGSLANGSFETGDFDGFATIGNASVVMSAFGTGPTNGRYQALLTTAAVPEPSSIVLLALGGTAGAGAFLRRRKAR
ncbi:PEP-CTERM sorting domain-containing protein [Aquisphaera insulae]|uniref:PEP-CTERM sorting domain-containing protein n=1 Tax=Aquisphaera insulae TaxID=2712864 RepID=UPI0013EE243C|nr:PEP-CTERM sorting domain-containing protein [Aquisphaera insulae]